MFEKIEINQNVEQNIDYREIHRNSIIDLKKKYERPPLAISIGFDPVAYKGVHYPLRFGTYGNISLIKGEEKARKTFLKSMILSCAIGGKASTFNSDIQGHDLKDKYIIDIDTEQDKYDNWVSSRRIPEMVGADYPMYVPVNLREYSSKEIRGYLEWLFMESEYKSNLGIVSIDGFVDCVDDFNNQIESKEFTRDLMRYSTITKCHITGVLHLNPNSEKARGHLGTILQQKCETVLIVKDEGSYASVTCQRSRGKRFEPFSFSVNNDWLPYKTDDVKGENWL